MALTQGHQVLCCDRNRRGGLKNIWLMSSETNPTSATTLSATNVYTVFPASNVYQFDFDRYTGQFTATGSRENGSTIVSVELSFYIPKVTARVNQRLDELASTCGLYAVVETYADDCASPALTYKFILGYDEIFENDAYLDFSSAEESTGSALQDANGVTVTLAGDAALFPAEYSGVMTAGTAYTDAWSMA